MNESSRDLPRVAVGAHLKLELISKAGAREALEVDLVSDAQADFEHGFLGANTPLARALMDEEAGTTVPYKMGDIVQVHIVGVTPSESAPPADAEAKRQAALRKAVDKADLTNAISYALSAENKWGDYDPEGIVENWEQGREGSADESKSEDKK